MPGCCAPGASHFPQRILPPMLYQIISLVLDVAVGLVCGTCLLRLYMQQQRIPMSARAGNPLGPFIFALTDWLVLPLRRLVLALSLPPARDPRLWAPGGAAANAASAAPAGAGSGASPMASMLISSSIANP